MTEFTFITQYRPQVFDEVIGQAAVVKKLKTVTRDKSSRGFLFCGPSGCGKTTLARIVAAELGVLDHDVLEIDAATNTGVQDMRNIQEAIRYVPIGKGSKRAVLIDECHRLSRQAWDSLLKAVEEPPPHLIWLFCTTEPGKVPQTLKTRCTHLTLKPVPEVDLLKLVDGICKKEKMSLAAGVADVIVKQANGSPRQALSNLGSAYEAKSRREAAQMLEAVEENDRTRELCQFILSGGSWVKAMSLMKALEEENPESLRIVIVNYIGAVMKNAKSDKDACHCLSILEAFSTPYNPSEGRTPLYLSLGRVLFSAE